MLWLFYTSNVLEDLIFNFQGTVKSFLPLRERTLHLFPVGGAFYQGVFEKNKNFFENKKAACSQMNRRQKRSYIVKGNKKKQAYHFPVICLLVVLDKDFDSHVIPLVFPQVLTD